MLEWKKLSIEEKIDLLTKILSETVGGNAVITVGLEGIQLRVDLVDHDHLFQSALRKLVDDRNSFLDSLVVSADSTGNADGAETRVPFDIPDEYRHPRRALTKKN